MHTWNRVAEEGPSPSWGLALCACGFKSSEPFSDCTQSGPTPSYVSWISRASWSPQSPFLGCRARAAKKRTQGL